MNRNLLKTNFRSLNSAPKWIIVYRSITTSNILFDSSSKRERSSSRRESGKPIPDDVLFDLRNEDKPKQNFPVLNLLPYAAEKKERRAFIKPAVCFSL